MANPEIKFNSPTNLDLSEGIAGLVSIGKVAVALALIGGITYYGIKKMTEVKKK